ncbi:MAG: hypothetical protein H0U71_07695 [Gammaproteobacteria bacterium]|nr:hypothetical protein [Gammaproteobacteria bacterium]
MIDDTLIRLTIPSWEHLAEVYIPFLKGGGLYIETIEQAFYLGQIVQINLKLPDEMTTLLTQVALVPAKKNPHPIIKAVGVALCDATVSNKLQRYYDKLSK